MDSCAGTGSVPCLVTLMLRTERSLGFGFTSVAAAWAFTWSRIPISVPSVKPVGSVK